MRVLALSCAVLLSAGCTSNPTGGTGGGDAQGGGTTTAGGGDATTAFTSELQMAVNGVLAGKEPALLSGKLARDALVMCHKECESVRSGRVVKVS